MGCAASLVKYILFLFNFVFVLASIAFIAIGVVFKLNIESYTEALNKLDSHFALAPVLMIIVGSIVFVIAFFGCCGAIRESTCMLTTYAIILLIIFILQIALGVYAFLQYKESDEEIKNDIKKGLKDSLQHYVTDDIARESVNSLQHGLQCCGVEKPEDWEEVFHNGTGPSSCCPNEPKDCPYSQAYQEGCFNKLFNFIQKSVNIVGIVVLVIAGTELAGAIIALCLSSSIRNNERRGNYA